MSKKVLDFSSAVAPEPVGEVVLPSGRYDILHPSALSVKDHARLARLQRVLAGVNEENFDEDAVAEAIVAFVKTIAPGLPVEEMSGAQMMSVIEVFIEAAS